MLEISATTEWRRSHPRAIIGLLEVSGIENAHPSPELNQRKRETELRLRGRFKGYSRTDFLSLPVIMAYHQYYKRFGKTYHVLLQLESIVLKGKTLPSVSPAVDANFLAEVDTLVLTAAHDVPNLDEPVSIDVARGADFITQMKGECKTIPVGDMIMRDAKGVCCSIIYGQDDRSPVSPGTTRVLYVAYAPAGIPADLVDAQLKAIEGNIRLFSQSAKVEQRRLLSRTNLRRPTTH